MPAMARDEVVTVLVQGIRNLEKRSRHDNDATALWRLRGASSARGLSTSRIVFSATRV